jgi:hypothetical protein
MTSSAIESGHTGDPSSTYKPLVAEKAEIRLLQLQTPFLEIGLTQCSLYTTSLTIQPKFTALSYVWGDTSIKEDIIVNEVIFPVTINLAMALRQIASTYGSVVLWVDAVCINQDDIDDRNNQVRQMGAIYSQTDSGISWLGPSDDSMIQATAL